MGYSRKIKTKARKVHAEFDGIPYDGRIVNMGVKDDKGQTCYIIGILRSIWKSLGKVDGDIVRVRIAEQQSSGLTKVEK